MRLATFSRRLKNSGGRHPMWQSLRCTVEASAAQKHAATTRFVRDFANEVEEPILFSQFKVAEALHSNFYHGWMEDHQFEESRDLVNEFVNRMIELTG